MSCDVPQHHDPRQADVTLSLTNVVHHGSHAPTVNDKLRQLRGGEFKDFNDEFLRCSLSSLSPLSLSLSSPCTELSFCPTLSCTNLNFLLDAVLHKIIILLDAVLHKIIILSNAVLHRIIILLDTVLHKFKFFVGHYPT